MVFLTFNSSKFPFPSIRQVKNGKMASVESKVEPAKLKIVGNKAAPIVFKSSGFEKHFIGKSVSVVKNNAKLKIVGNKAAPIVFKRHSLIQPFGNVSFVRPKPKIVTVMSGKILKLSTSSLLPYEPKKIDVILSEKPIVGGVSGDFNLEFSMLRNEIRTFKFPFKFLQTLKNNNGAKVSGEYLTFNSEEIGEYDFIGDGGMVKIVVSPALVMSEVNLNTKV